MEILIAILIGFVISLIIMMVHKSALKTVHMQSSAKDYIKDGSFRLTNKREIYLYKKVDKTPKPKDDD